MTDPETPPTEPPTPDTTDTTYDAADLLGDDGTVSHAKVAAITSVGEQNSANVTTTECRRWRRAVRKGTQPRAVETTFDQAAVRYHVTGECSHDHGEPAATYDHDAEQWVINE